MERPDTPGSDLGTNRGDFQALMEIAGTITGTLDLGRVMQSIVERVGERVDAPSCSILLADSRSPGCFVLASRGHPEIDMLEIDLAKYPEIRHVLETRHHVVVEEVSTDPLVAQARELLLAQGFHSMLIQPLVVGTEVVGVLFVKSRRVNSFPPAVLRFCKAVADVSANALKNALLYRDVKEAGEKLRHVLDASPDMIAATNDKGRITEFNPGAERITGLSAADAVNRRLADVLGVPDLDENVDGREPLELTLERPGKPDVVVSLAGAPLSDTDGERAGGVWIGRDVTKLRQVEKSLAQAERLSSLGEVVAGVAHELNNPLSGVVGYAELLRSNAEDPAQIADLVRIVESALRCQKIVYKLLSFARKHAPEKKFQSLNDCVAKVLDLKEYHLRSSQIETVLELDPELPRTCFDFHQIDQVILNLLNNAEQACRSIRGSGTIAMRTGVDGNTVYVEVEDNGPGVPEGARERVFDPFFTTKDIGEGTGLGLSVSYGIVQEHGGTIDLLPARSGSGARFRVSIPLVEGQEDPAEESGGEAGDEDKPLRGRRILVAEDEPMVLELFDRLLSREGVEVTLAHDGEEAWDELEGEDFDLVVADLCMPNVSGQEFYERVAVERPDMLRRFVFATGDLARKETLAFLEGLPNRILTKPLEVETVRRTLTQALSSSVE